MLINNINQLGYQIIVVDKDLSWVDNSIVFFNNQPIRKLFALVSNSDFVVSNDSGLLHIAAAFDKPTLSIFGPTDPKMRCVYPKSKYITLNLACMPCWYNRCDGLDCLNLLSVNQVEVKLLEEIVNEFGQTHEK